MAGFVEDYGSSELEEYEVVCDWTGLVWDARYHKTSPYVDENDEVYFGTDFRTVEVKV